MSEQEQFHSVEYCHKEICEVRKYIGDNRATERTFQSAFATLGLMLLHCPAEVVPTVEAQLTETNARYSYAIFRPGFFDENNSLTTQQPSGSLSQ